jgi:hypothetical protein
MLTGLQMEFVLHPDTRVLHLPRSPAQADAASEGPPVRLGLRPAAADGPTGG